MAYMPNLAIAILAKKNNQFCIEMKKQFFLVLHNIRSAYNVGSIFRTADGAGAAKIFLTGYTPAPAGGNSSGKNPIYVSRAQKMISKTALGAEKNIPWEKAKNISRLLKELKKERVRIVALEQNEKSIDYREAKLDSPTALIVGNELKGIDKKILAKCDTVIEIPMRGKKNSLNVSVALGIAAYEVSNKSR